MDAKSSGVDTHDVALLTLLSTDWDFESAADDFDLPSKRAWQWSNQHKRRMQPYIEIAHELGVYDEWVERMYNDLSLKQKEKYLAILNEETQARLVFTLSFEDDNVHEVEVNSLVRKVMIATQWDVNKATAWTCARIKEISKVRVSEVPEAWSLIEKTCAEYWEGYANG